MKNPIEPWLPAIFCAFISLIALFGSVGSSGESAWWRPAFLSFLPLCFFFAGSAMVGLRKRVEELERQLEASKSEGR